MNGRIINLCRARPRLARTTAVHEAGHAVVGEALGCPVDLVSIIPAATSRGRCVFAPETLQKGAERAAAWLAGPMASELLEQERLRAPDIDPEPAWLTYAELAEAPEPPPGVAGVMLDDDAGANAAVRSPEGLPWARTMALTILATRWDTVVALAEALGRVGELDGAGVRRIIERES